MNSTSKPSIWRRWLIGKRPRHTLPRAVALGVACYVIFSYIWLPVFVRGTSMEPTYQDGAFNFANAWVYRASNPKRGDVVVIEMAGRRTMYMKRILGMPGETVYFDEGQLMIDGAPWPEPYVVKDGDWTTEPEPLELHEYFVAGDNRSSPRETHVMGVVDRVRIAGRIIW